MLGVFFFGVENRRAVGFFLEQKNLQRQFFFGRKESQIIFGYTFFYIKVFLDQIQMTVFG